MKNLYIPLLDNSRLGFSTLMLFSFLVNGASSSELEISQATGYSKEIITHGKVNSLQAGEL